MLLIQAICHCRVASRTVILAALLAAGSWRTAAAPAPTPALPGTLIYDQHSRGEEPRNFRTAGDVLTNAGDETGLASLRVSGSSSFDARGLQWILNRIGEVRAKNHLAAGPVTVMDLRQESHGYINGGIPVSWMGEHDWANQALARDGVLALETRLLSGLAAAGQAMISEEAAFKAGQPNPRAVTVTNVMTEEQLVEQSGVRYVRLMVTDHLRPSDAEVDRFMAVTRALPADGWLHVHCHAGRGRTTTFLVMWDMLHNAGTVSLAEITKRQSLLAGGDIDLLSVETTKDWERPAARERREFLQRFYEYAKTKPLAAGAPTWSEWVKTPQAR